MRSEFSHIDAEKLAVVRRWHDDREVWKRTGRGPDDSTFPPSWPFAHVETERLIHNLATLCNDACDDLNTWQIVTDPEAGEKYVEQARQRLMDVPRTEVTP